MALAPGIRLGRYEIRAPLGAGGMGEVYRATDLGLRREVAIKILPEQFAHDSARLARFAREARILAALNHPNIASIYGFEETGDASFLVMELVDGETLAERLVRTGPLPVDEVLRVAGQIAEALDAAHGKGIVHRDLKPANIKVTPEGRVKVLDFGLAKSQMPDSPADLSRFSTVANVETELGVIAGTAPYMSPEQVRGHATDHRTDVWAFGCVVYELLSATRAFRGQTQPDTLAAVLQGEPEWSVLPALPGALRSLLLRTLDKDLTRRCQAASDLRAELVRAGSDTASRYEVRPRFEGLVVLPLRNLSGDPADEFFADGMTEALIWDLAKLRALRVISRTSAMRYKASDQRLPEIARELNVEAVVEGSVARQGERVIIRAQLIQASSDTTIWSESYDRDLRDVLILQSEIARAIATAIQVAVSPEENLQLTEDARPVDPAAFEAYLKGQFHWGKLTPVDLDAALGYFERARDKEPALGEVGIAAVWLARQQMNLSAPHVAGPLAKQAALRALEAGESRPEVHYINALVNWAVDWDWKKAGLEFERTFALRASYAEARAYHSHFLAIMQQPEAAILEMRRALDIDPHNALFRCLFGIVLVFARQYEAAIEELQAVQRVVPPNLVITRGLVCAFHLTGRFDEALAENRAWFVALGDREAVDALDRGASYAESLHLAADTLAGRGRYYSPCDIMQMYLRAGRTQQALDWLEIGFDQRDPDMAYLRNPIADPLRHEPRYESIVRRMNLPAEPQITAIS